MMIEVKPSVNVDVTVQFEDPKWVALVERSDAQGEKVVARVEFASQPSEAEVRDYVIEHYESLQFSASGQAGPDAALKGHAALKRLLEQRQHQNAIAARLQHGGGKPKFSVRPTKHKERHRGVR